MEIRRKPSEAAKAEQSVSNQEALTNESINTGGVAITPDSVERFGDSNTAFPQGSNSLGENALGDNALGDNALGENALSENLLSQNSGYLNTDYLNSGLLNSIEKQESPKAEAFRIHNALYGEPDSMEDLMQMLDTLKEIVSSSSLSSFDKQLLLNDIANYQAVLNIGESQLTEGVLQSFKNLQESIQNQLGLPDAF